MLKPGIDLGHLIGQDKGKNRDWNQHFVAAGNIYFEDVVVQYCRMYVYIWDWMTYTMKRLMSFFLIVTLPGNANQVLLF